GSKPCSVAQCAHTRLMTCVVSINTPSKSNSRALQLTCMPLMFHFPGLNGNRNHSNALNVIVLYFWPFVTAIAASLLARLTREQLCKLIPRAPVRGCC